jgi:maltose alpha-D-glucosyltransferase/alpha-amylase
LRFLQPQNRKVLAYLREFDGETIFCVVNVPLAQAVELTWRNFPADAVEMLGGAPFPAIAPSNYLLTLPHAFYRFPPSQSTEPPSWSTATSGPPNLHLRSGRIERGDRRSRAHRARG